MLKGPGVEDNRDFSSAVAERVGDFYSCFSLFRKDSFIDLSFFCGPGSVL